MAELGIARRYAEGAFQLAQEEKGVDAWREDLARLEAMLRNEKVRDAFGNPSVTIARRLDLAERLAPDLSQRARNLLRLLIERQRTGLIPDIRREFDRLADEAAGIVDVTLTTAVELDDQSRDRYEKALTESLGRRVRVHHAVQPSLVGGATVLIGDRLTDGSVRSQLARLRRELVG